MSSPIKGTIFSDGAFSSNLQDLVIPILDIEYCKKAYRNRPGSNVDNRNLCAGYLNGKKDSCQVRRKFHQKENFSLYYF